MGGVGECRVVIGASRGECRVERAQSGEWRVESTEWRVESTEWRVDSGVWWRVESGMVSGECSHSGQGTVTMDSEEWSGEWRVESTEYRVERRECGACRRKSARRRSPPIGDHTADSIWFFIFADCLISRLFVCFVLLQFFYSKP